MVGRLVVHIAIRAATLGRMVGCYFGAQIQEIKHAYNKAFGGVNIISQLKPVG